MNRTLAERAIRELDQLDRQFGIERQHVIRVRREHRPPTLTSEQSDVGINRVRRARRAKHVAKDARNSAREIHNLGLVQKKRHGHLLPSVPTPHLRNHPSRGHEPRLSLGEDVNQTDGHSVTPLDRNEEPGIEHHAA